MERLCDQVLALPDRITWLGLVTLVEYLSMAAHKPYFLQQLRLRVASLLDNVCVDVMCAAFKRYFERGLGCPYLGRLLTQLATLPTHHKGV